MNYHNSLQRLVNIMNDLREQCPWDKKQTIHSLRTQTIEELYELTDAITEEDWKGIREELGDLLLHIVFYSKIGAEQNQFTLDDVIEGVANKLVFRHPHIYSNTLVEGEEDVKKNWEKLKLKEGKKSVLGGVPQSLPAVVKATRLQDKAKQVGFEWDTAAEVLEKVREEMNELQEAIDSGHQQHVEEEFGDVLFSLVNYARFLKVDAENALEKTNKKFKYRFEQMENLAAQRDLNFTELSLLEMDALWNEVKKSE
ncbi:nucleoside triphosphate pyrophosphohydrolase [Taibaiella sp. KBW10]|uniref:nucleoside triphosphate pyrophosphohydrolase n=1 Tax=Taibaiella sp. KBW10 TaxID=2153357 RepID=UPI000F5A75DC|nr:nucleoside triphosphate pyrophosphohydrolase [Taibaiella sp. KBW10]RQO30185.1 nucleoside triphosphate pyrophosphohydrolase [Taibaiella sp. KBW10]